MPSSSDQTRVDRTLTLGGGAESSLEGGDIELSVSPKDIRTSPYDLCAKRSDRGRSRAGADGSNPLPSSGESGTNLIFGGESHRWRRGLRQRQPSAASARGTERQRITPDRRTDNFANRLSVEDGSQ